MENSVDIIHCTSWIESFAVAVTCCVGILKLVKQNSGVKCFSTVKGIISYHSLYQRWPQKRKPKTKIYNKVQTVCHLHSWCLRKKGKKGINYYQKSALHLVCVNRKVIDERLFRTMCILEQLSRWEIKERHVALYLEIKYGDPLRGPKL